MILNFCGMTNLMYMHVKIVIAADRFSTDDDSLCSLYPCPKYDHLQDLRSSGQKF